MIHSMPSAYTKDTTHDTILGGGHMKVSDPFDIGAGHINPMKAMDPGLVYDMTTIDYIMYLCSIAYTEGHIRRIVSLSKISSATCPKGSKKAYNINFPSIILVNLTIHIDIGVCVYETKKAKMFQNLCSYYSTRANCNTYKRKSCK